MNKMNILVAEDDEDSARLLKRILQDAGYDVIMARDGNQAWKVLQRADAPKLAVLDWMMPGMSGIDICKRLREKHEDVRTYVVLVTAKGKKRDVIKGLDSGADDFVTKPVDKGELLARLRVAGRTLDLQKQFVQVIERQQSLLQRHNLLRQQVWKPGRSTQNGKVTSDDSDVADLSRPCSHSAAPELRPLAEMDQFLVNILNEIGFPMTASMASSISLADQDFDFTSWCALIIKSKGIWFDFKMETSRITAGEVFHSLSGATAKSDTDLVDTMSELANMYVDNLKIVLQQQNLDTLKPYVAKAMYTREVPARFPLGIGHEQHILSGAGRTIRFTAIQYPAQAVKKAMNKGCALDVLAEPIYQSAGEDLLLLSEGTALDYQYIQKLHDFLGDKRQQCQISVLEPSPLTLIFNRAHERFSAMYTKRRKDRK